MAAGSLVFLLWICGLEDAGAAFGSNSYVLWPRPNAPKPLPIPPPEGGSIDNKDRKKKSSTDNRDSIRGGDAAVL